MINFYLLADPILGGQAVRLTVSEGSERLHQPIGSITFTLPQWESFSKVLYGGIKAVSYMRIGVQFRDRSHTQKRPDQ